MKKQLRSLALLCAAFVVFTGCEKDKDPEPAAKTKTELLTLAPWKFKSATSGSIDISALPAISCYTDNTVTFASNGTGTTTEGTNVCSSPSPATFEWSFTNNENTLHLNVALLQGGSPDFTIITLDETNLVVSQSVTIAPMPAQTVVVTFEH